MKTRLSAAGLFGFVLALFVTIPTSAGVIGTGSDEEKDGQSIIQTDAPEITVFGVIGTGNEDENNETGVIGTGNENENEGEGVIGSGHRTQWMPRWLAHLIYGFGVIR